MSTSQAFRSDRYIWLVCLILLLALSAVFVANFGWYESAQEILHSDNRPRYVAASLGLVVVVVSLLLYSLAVNESRRQAQIERQYRKALEEAYLGTLHALTYALDLRDNETYGHSLRVMHLSVAIGRRFGLSNDELRTLAWGALIHDIGKIGIKDQILQKPGPLSEEEMEIMRQHVTIGHHLVRSVPFLAPTADLIRHHHERYDGQGYPDGLAGEDIPLLARIFSVADGFDAMTTLRPYRPVPLTMGEAIETIRAEAGLQYCPVVVEKFLQIPVSELYQIYANRITPLLFADIDLLVNFEDNVSTMVNSYYRDPLTGTGSRAAWEARAAQLAHKTGRDLGTIIFFDMNRLKEINDNNGHAVGDAVLADFGDRLLKLAPEVFRTGGDEFVAWFPPGQWTLEVEAKLRTLMNEFASAWDSIEPCPTVSWGVSHATNNTRSIHDLLYQADQAMYKRKRRNRQRPPA